MRATFVVHEAEQVSDTATRIVARPVVNEPDTNREWSPGSTPAGELRLTVTNAIAAANYPPGKRLQVTIELEPTAKKAAPAPKK